MALYAFDGTWNAAKDGDDTTYTNTNVVRFHQAYHARSKTDDFYLKGVGTRFDLVGKVVGGVFGMGELPRINEAYDHLCAAWAAGDRIIDIVGFSRGAATTLDFCHRIQEAGIRRPGSNDVIEPKPTIRFLGVWDVVAAFGLANLGNTALNIGHHLELPKSNLQYCFHGMALDEHRPSFLQTRLSGACEVWFRGVHSDVGGGNTNRGLNDIALKWMMSKAKAAGLPITDEDIAALKPDPTSPPHFDPAFPLSVRVVSAVDRRHYSVSDAKGCTMPPATCSVETEGDERSATPLGADSVQVLPLIVRQRIDALWRTADARAKQLEFPIDAAKDALVTLFQGRVSLITNDDDIVKAERSVLQLVSTMVEGARARGFHAMSEFFLNEALFKLPHLFPLTD
jgi:hypothetical protein